MNIFTLNGSDTDWLVYADYLEDQGIDATHIREGVAEPQLNDWHWDVVSNDAVGVLGGVGVDEEGVGVDAGGVGSVTVGVGVLGGVGV